MQQPTINSESMGFIENGIGHFIRMCREAKGYSQLDICDGICSTSLLSLIEKEEKQADFWTVEALLERMKTDNAEYEFILDDDTFALYRLRETIQMNILNKEYAQAKENLAVYQETCGEGKLHQQFLLFQRACLERIKPESDKHRKKELFEKALMVTAPNYKETYDRKGILSDLELECIAEIMHCTEDPKEREEEYKDFYNYFQLDRQREGFFPPAYRIAMQYYAECLYENGKMDDCMKICDEVLQELYGTSKVANRAQIFILRAKAREGKGIHSEEEKKLCMKDYMTAYAVISFYDGEEEAKELEEYIRGNYGWPYTD